MIKGILFFCIVWCIVTFGVLGFSYLSTDIKLSVFKAVVYGLVTALLALGIVVGMVVLF